MLYVDASYYFSTYTNFIGFNIGIDAEFGENGLPTDIQAFRYSANSLNQVQTQGFSIGMNYFIGGGAFLDGLILQRNSSPGNYSFGLNYSWNKLTKTNEDDPIIPAFNTPEHKFNLSFSARELKSTLGKGNTWGYSVNYKWIQGFVFEGSPQFTGFVPTYDLVDAQVNFFAKSLNTTFKIGASNVLNNMQFQTYGGPRIGRLAYFSILYELGKVQ